MKYKIAKTAPLAPCLKILNVSHGQRVSTSKQAKNVILLLKIILQFCKISFLQKVSQEINTNAKMFTNLITDFFSTVFKNVDYYQVLNQRKSNVLFKQYHTGWKTDSNVLQLYGLMLITQPDRCFGQESCLEMILMVIIYIVIVLKMLLMSESRQHVFSSSAGQKCYVHVCIMRWVG